VTMFRREELRTTRLVLRRPGLADLDDVCA
jgi:hypothetical protein